MAYVPLFCFYLRVCDIQVFQAVEDVDAHDPLVDLLGLIESFLKYLGIYTKIPRTAVMTEIVVKTLGELLFVLALATKLIKQGQPGELSSLTFYLAQPNEEKFVEKLSGKKDVDAVLQRLDRLTQDEARIAAAQILEVVHGLAQTMRVVMDGEQIT